MNRELQKRLDALTQRVTKATTGIVPIEVLADDDGGQRGVLIPALRRELTFIQFFMLMDLNPDVAYVPFAPVPDPTCEAYYAVEEEALLSVTWADLQAENEAAERARAGGPYPGPGAVDRARTQAAAADPERAEMAAEYVEDWPWLEENFWTPTRERVDRLPRGQGR